VYVADEVDAIAAYCAPLDRCYFLPLASLTQRRYVQLRLAPTRNNQRRGINWAEDFEFGATLGRLGAVAQLGERRAGSAKATGSSPVGSIVEAPPLAVPSPEGLRSVEPRGRV
jgi:hypothetical protein